MNSEPPGQIPACAHEATPRPLAVEDDMGAQLSARVYAQRTAVGWSRQHLAAIIHLPDAVLALVEDGLSDLPAATLPRLAAALGKPIDWFYRPLVRRTSATPPELDTSKMASLPAELGNLYAQQLLAIATCSLGMCGETTRGKGANMVRGRILLVDDEPDILSGLAYLLVQEGFEVTTATNGSDALRIAINKEALDIVITDHAMPGTTGVALLVELSELRPSVAGIVISAYAAAISLGELPPGAALLRKPFRREVLLDKIAELMSRDMIRNQTIVPTDAAQATVTELQPSSRLPIGVSLSRPSPYEAWKAGSV